MSERRLDSVVSAVMFVKDFEGEVSVDARLGKLDMLYELTDDQSLFHELQYYCGEAVSLGKTPNPIVVENKISKVMQHFVAIFNPEDFDSEVSPGLRETIISDIEKLGPNAEASFTEEGYLKKELDVVKNSLLLTWSSGQKTPTSLSRIFGLETLREWTWLDKTRLKVQIEEIIDSQRHQSNDSSGERKLTDLVGLLMEVRDFKGVNLPEFRMQLLEKLAPYIQNKGMYTDLKLAFEDDPESYGKEELDKAFRTITLGILSKYYPTEAQRENVLDITESTVPRLIDKALERSQSAPIPVETKIEIIYYGIMLFWLNDMRIPVVLTTAWQMPIDKFGVMQLEDLKQSAGKIFAVKYMSKLDNSDVFGKKKRTAKEVLEELSTVKRELKEYTDKADKRSTALLDELKDLID